MNNRVLAIVRGNSLATYSAKISHSFFKNKGSSTFIFQMDSSELTTYFIFDTFHIYILWKYELQFIQIKNQMEIVSLVMNIRM